MEDKKSFLGRLFDKRKYVGNSQEQSGKNFTSALNEVDRQIKQSGSSINGQDVTKSGNED